MRAGPPCARASALAAWHGRGPGLASGDGFLLDFHVMRLVADIEAIHTNEGTETIQTLTVGRDFTGASAFA